MSIARRAAVVLALSGTTAVFGLGSAARAAPTGTISDVHALTTGQVSATFTTSHDVVDPDGYAGWYPFAVAAPAGQPCDAGSQPVIYVGDWQRTPGSQRQTKAFAIAPNETICLYTEHGGLDTVVATYVWVPPPPAPPPAESGPPPSAGSPAPTEPAPAPVGPASPAPQAPLYLTLPEARRVVRHALVRRFGPRFTAGRNYRRSCRHLADIQVRCRVTWDWQRYHYAGTLTVLESRYGYSTKRAIRRTPS
jgi:hypothetical protein